MAIAVAGYGFGMAGDLRGRVLAAPLWARCVVAAVVFGGGWLFYLAFLDPGPERLPPAVAIGMTAVMSGVFGVSMGVSMRRQERLMFQTWGAQLHGSARGQVRRAVAANRPPEDARLAEAAASFARYQVSRRNSPVLLTVLFGGLAALGAWNAVSRPWWWVFVAAVVVTGVVGLRSTVRGRRVARRYLATTGAGAAGAPDVSG